MRELEGAGVCFESVTYEVDESDTSSELGLHIAETLGDDPASSFKTLVCVAPSGDHVVCCIPVAAELDLKRAAAAAGEKSLELMVDPGFLESLRRAHDQILAFHEREREESWFTTRDDGTILGVKVTPVASAAIYVPGGRAQYPSTVLMQTGVDVDDYRRIARVAGFPVVASGGIASLDDVRALAVAGPEVIEGCITGRAIYEGNFTLEAALAAAGA